MRRVDAGQCDILQVGAMRRDSNILALSPKFNENLSSTSNILQSPYETMRTPMDGKSQGPLKKKKLKNIQAKSLYKKKKKHSWPYALTSVCFGIIFVAILMYPLPEFRLQLRYQMYTWLGTTLEGNQWVGGHRQLSYFIYIFAFVAVPMMVAGALFSGSHSVAPILEGKQRLVCLNILAYLNHLTLTNNLC